MSDHGIAKPIKFVLAVILMAIFWEFFIGNNYPLAIDFTKSNKEQQFEQEKFKNNIKGYMVKRVVDGDTFIIQDNDSILNNGETRVRMIGVNTPESADPRRPVECMGKEAAEYLKSLIEGKIVYLDLDNTQGIYDKYDRLLAYVKTSEKEDINKKMITEGYGYEYTYDKSNPYMRQAEYKQSQNFAKFGERGIWDKTICK